MQPDTHLGHSDSPLDALLKLYRPNTSRGNFMADVSSRGGNSMLVKVAVALGIAPEEEMAAHFKRLDTEAYERSEAAIRRIEERERA